MNATATENGRRSQHEHEGQADPVLDGIINNTRPFESESAIGALVKAEVDVQVSTAKAYPRSLTRFRREAMDMACVDTETAESCFFVLPRGGKKISGPSVRLAEIVASSWGNLLCGARIIADDGKMITAQGFAWDLERNNRRTAEIQRRVTDSKGRRYSDDMVIMTCNAASSIAFRNAVFSVVPRCFVNPILAEVRRVAVGDVKTLAVRRQAMLEHFAKMGLSEKRVFAAVGAKGVEDIGLDELAELKGLATSVKDGDIDIDAAFPDEKNADAAKKKLEPGSTDDKDKEPGKQPDVPPASKTGDDEQKRQEQDERDLLEEELKRTGKKAEEFMASAGLKKWRDRTPEQVRAWLEELSKIQ